MAQNNGIGTVPDYVYDPRSDACFFAKTSILTDSGYQINIWLPQGMQTCFRRADIIL